MTDVTPWDYVGDHIKKVINFKAFTKDMFYAVVIRNSGMVDIYANMDKLTTIKDKTFEDIDYDAANIYFKDTSGELF